MEDSRKGKELQNKTEEEPSVVVRCPSLYVNDVIDIIGRDRLVETIAKNMGVPPDDVPDLSQLIYLQLLEKGDVVVQLYNDNQLNFYISRLVSNNYFSKTSRYYYIYKKYYEHIDANHANRITIDDDNQSDWD